MNGSKLWRNKTEIRNVKSAQIVEFIKTYDQYPHKFNLVIFSCMILLLSAGWKIDFQKNAVLVKWVIFFSLEEYFAERGGGGGGGYEHKWKDLIFRLVNVSSSNLNTINLKFFQGPQPDSANAGAKNVLNDLENDTKKHF